MLGLTNNVKNRKQLTKFNFLIVIPVKVWMPSDFLLYLADPGKARGCSVTKSLMVCGNIFMALSRPSG